MLRGFGFRAHLVFRLPGLGRRDLHSAVKHGGHLMLQGSFNPIKRVILELQSIIPR